jgi:exodeoxyribonuclease V alpha subunit
LKEFFYAQILSEKGEIILLCQFERLIYPQNVSSIDAGSFMIAVYRPCENIRDSAGNMVTQVKAVGYCLPIADNLRYELQGHWSKNPKHGVQFEVENYDEVITPTKEGIIAYLSSGQIKGIGPKMAEKIYDAFGLTALDVLDKEPERLLSISGISTAKLKKICDSYLANRGARDVVAFLTPHGITPNRAVKLYKEYGDQAMDIVKNHPYQLCEIAGIGFKTADRIAMSMGFDQLSVERVDEGILYALTDAEGKGHLCMEKHAFIKACLKVLDTPQLTEDMVANRAARLVYSGKLVSYQGNVYRSKTAYAESNLAELLSRQLRSARSHSYGDLDAALDAEELRMKVKFAPEQREAVKMALTQGVSVITGGPGTGKSMILRAILDIYRRQNPGKEICLCAPTGRAARRMEQATGLGASTVHKALGLLAGEDGDYGEPQALDADIILVDEVSMMDIYLAGRLLEAVKSRAQVVLIGDSDQLPSVGPGAVLSEMIASERIPVVRLDKVFRQNDGSRIAVNAKLIRHGNLSLEYGNDFRFVDSANLSDSASRIAELYMQEVARYGVDNVAMLSPYRQKTETGVNALNEMLRELVNPPDEGKPEVVCGKRKFRVGDKVMQVKNFEDVSNGDVGYIRNIFKFGDETTVCVDFGDGRNMEYDSSELDMLDLGYASTIHKAQGAEYQSVIINLQCAHHIMLTRPLIYTAITRGKDRVIIVGERRALCISIKKTDIEKRGTCLAHRLQELA